MAGFGFQTQDYDHTGGRNEPIPAGEYQVIVEESELKDTQSGGQMIKLTLLVVGDRFQNRKLWVNANIHNRNDTAQKMGRELIASLAYSCGNPGAQDSNQLHNIPVIAKVVVKGEDSDQYGRQNEVKMFKPVGGAKPVGVTGGPGNARAGQPPSQPQTTGSTTSRSKGATPWQGGAA